MHCSECRAEILDSWLFCPQCGKSVSAGPISAEFCASVSRPVLLSEERFLDRLPSGVLFVTPRRRIGYLNRAASALFGINPSQNPVGKLMEEVIRHPECVAILQDILEEGMQSSAKKKVCRTDAISVQDQHETENIYQVHASHLLDEARIPAGTVFLFQDITDLRNVERKKQKILSVVSYRQRACLVTVLGFVRTLLEEAEGEEQYDQAIRREFYAIMEENAERAMRLTLDVFDLLRPLPRPAEMIWEQIALRAVTEEVIGEQQRHTTKHTFIVDCEPAEIEVEADRYKLYSILQHFVANAVEYSPHGGDVRIIARLKPADDEFPYASVAIGVKDQGIGISPADLQWIAEHVPEVHNTDASRATGIGLLLAKKLIAAHRGTMKVESAVGQGSTFWMRLPIQQCAKAEGISS